ncbi:uncharacterized protein N7479_005614 [Penicillium vulpinum]|uniref:Uncharacterized protein n=1 Tax=Penicillium vulpinum TaxID=29845 RepID=A0A1V6SDE5_9EURO|nr:uncharacterized protein N7479_005614 [Penicillium vulpinum]KAJ5958464.1 hypothetical protein N7479_005614 [Penicillium vulpinum]OQE12027.1 hypothetical protein PENVUL_c001G05167 [Penicillium vulpinum]
MASSNPHAPEALREALTALGNTLGDETYALVGGSACTALGSERATQDIDFVVLRGQTPAVRNLLRHSDDFEVEARTYHTWYKAAEPVEIEILAPPALFRETFDELTEVITVGNLKVLKPALLLNAKCGSILSRASEAKKRTDAQDILFLLGYCAEHPDQLPKAAEVPNANKEFVEAFIRKYSGQEAWIGAGYDLERGCFTRD